MTGVAFPKPKDIRNPAPAVRTYRDGREVCNLLTAAGKREYRNRVLSMLTSQEHVCCLCKRPLRPEDATFEHEIGRGMGGGHRDDRIEINGKWVNGAAHYWCNSRKEAFAEPTMNEITLTIPLIPPSVNHYKKINTKTGRWYVTRKQKRSKRRLLSSPAVLDWRLNLTLWM